MMLLRIVPVVWVVEQPRLGIVIARLVEEERLILLCVPRSNAEGILRSRVRNTGNGLFIACALSSVSG